MTTVELRPIAEALEEARRELAETAVEALRVQRLAARRFHAGNKTRFPALRDLLTRRAELEAIVAGLEQLKIVETYGGLLAEIHRAAGMRPALEAEVERLSDPALFDPSKLLADASWASANELYQLREKPHQELASAQARVMQLEAFIDTLHDRERVMLREHGPMLEDADRDLMAIPIAQNRALTTTG